MYKYQIVYHEALTDIILKELKKENTSVLHKLLQQVNDDMRTFLATGFRSGMKDDDLVYVLKSCHEIDPDLLWSDFFYR